MKKINMKNLLYIFLGCCIFSIGINWFASPNKLVTGGASGVAIILTNIFKTLTGYDIPISVLVFFINIPVFIFSLTINGSKFLKKSLLATILLTFLLYIFSMIPNFFKIENDIFLASILTGIFCGIGSGLILKIGASLGGTDMLANSVNKIWPHIPIPTTILILDATIVLVGFLIFGATKATYGILAIFVSSKIINNILGGLRFARAVFIVSEKTEEISDEIFKTLKRGNTNINCTGMYTKKQKNILVVVLWPKEIVKLKKIIDRNDKKAFVIICPAQEVLGKGF